MTFPVGIPNLIEMMVTGLFRCVAAVIGAVDRNHAEIARVREKAGEENKKIEIALLKETNTRQRETRALRRKTAKMGAFEKRTRTFVYYGIGLEAIPLIYIVLHLCRVMR
jgi:hypothetical protein